MSSDPNWCKAFFVLLPEQTDCAHCLCACFQFSVSFAQEMVAQLCPVNLFIKYGIAC